MSHEINFNKSINPPHLLFTTRKHVSTFVKENYFSLCTWHELFC